MRPLLLVTVDWPPIEGGISTLATGLVEGLQQSGERPLVIAPRLAGARAPGALQPELWLSPLYGLGPLRLVPLALTTLLAVARRRPRALVALNVAYGGSLGWLLRRFTGLGYLTLAYGFEFLKFRDRPLPRRALCAIYNGSIAVVAISQYARARLVELGVEPARIVVVPPGARPVCAAPPAPGIRARHGLEKRRVLLTVSRLIARKGLLELGEAMAGVLETCSDCVWVIVGRGPLRPALEALARGSGLEDRVHLIGHAGASELEAWYGEAELFALTPLELPGDAEGFGIVYLEAALHGLPAVAARSGGVPEAVIDGVTGLVVPAGDVAAIRKALLELLADPARARALGQAARQRAAGFTWERFARELIALSGGG